MRSAQAREVLEQMNTSANTRATLIPDILGSVIGSLASSTGAITKMGYRAFGESASTSGEFGYTGARFEASGHYDFRARIYSPTLGRFLQADPIGTQGGMNLYAYVGNDPLNATDPSGLTSSCDQFAQQLVTDYNQYMSGAGSAAPGTGGGLTSGGAG
jgi:RHS repeat-associated protein